MKKKCISILLAGMILFTACGKNDQQAAQSLDLNALSGTEVHVSVSDDTFQLKSIDDGFVISNALGNVHGEFISEIEANNLMAKYYSDAGYHAISAWNNDGFGYIVDGDTDSVSGDSVSDNESGMFAHVIKLESGDYIRFVCESEDALMSIEESMMITVDK